MCLKNKNICFYLASFSIGGVESVSICYANKLVELGYKVFCMVCHNDSLSEHLDHRVNLINLNVNRLRYALPQTCKAIIKYNIDIMICSNQQVLYPLVSKFLCNWKLKIVSSHHFYCNNAETSYRDVAPLKVEYNLSDVVYAVSQGIKKELIETIGVKREKIVVIDNPINVQRIREKAEEYQAPNEGIPSITWVGRFSVVKNIPLLLDAFELFWRKHPEYHLYLIGDGEEMENILNKISIMHCKNYIHVEGIKSNPMPYIKNSMIHTLSSSSEAQPIVLREALALGKRIVSTPTLGAMESLERGKYGYISKSMNVEDFYEGLEYMLKSEINKDEIDQWIWNFDINQIIKLYIKMLEGLYM